MEMAIGICLFALQTLYFLQSDCPASRATLILKFRPDIKPFALASTLMTEQNKSCKIPKFENRLNGLYIGSSVSRHRTGWILIIDFWGSIASRRFDFNYAYLSLLSFALYTYIAFCLSKFCIVLPSLTVNFVIGIIDATLGVIISIKLKAKTNLTEKDRYDKVGFYSLVTVLVFVLICTTVGYSLARFI
jgi:hypothetical protein